VTTRNVLPVERPADATTVGWCTSLEPASAEILAISGVDMVCLDGEHGIGGWDQLLRVLHLLTAGGTPTLVRVPTLDPVAIGHALDNGAHGVVVPFVESADDARTAVRACRYPPHGDRSWGPSRSTAFRASRTSADPVCVVMVETSEAIAQADQIAGVDGVSAVLVGARDLALTLGLDPTGQHHLSESPPFLELVGAVASACARHSVPAAVPVSTRDQADRVRGLGYTWLVLPSDINLLQQAVQSSLGRLIGPAQPEDRPPEDTSARYRPAGLADRKEEP
jgi:4-hydroxy-2-oxoheptanedioate aldolase